MQHDTMTVFDTSCAPRAEPTSRLYHKVTSLRDGELVAMRASRIARLGLGHHRKALQLTLTEAAGWPSTIALWLEMPAGSLNNRDFLLSLRLMLRHAGLPAARLSLELPEASALRLTHDGLLLLSALRDTGVGLVLAEFGGAIASLSMLTRLPLTAMKLSPALVCGLPADREDAGLVRAAIGVADTLGLPVVADGVAGGAQHDWLSRLGCMAGMGSFFGPAISATDLNGLSHGD